MVATLGPEAWPAPSLEELTTAISESRQLHPLLRDQRQIAGIGRSWVDEILWEAKLARFARARISTPTRSSGCATRCTSSATRSTTTRR